MLLYIYVFFPTDCFNEPNYCYYYMIKSFYLLSNYFCTFQPKAVFQYINRVKRKFRFFYLYEIEDKFNEYEKSRILYIYVIPSLLAPFFDVSHKACNTSKPAAIMANHRAETRHHAIVRRLPLLQLTLSDVMLTFNITIDIEDQYWNEKKYY